MSKNPEATQLREGRRQEYAGGGLAPRPAGRISRIGEKEYERFQEFPYAW
jgi:hypothetical protein